MPFLIKKIDLIRHQKKRDLMGLAVFNQITPTINDGCCPFCRDTVQDNPNEEWYGHLVNNGPAIHYIHKNCLIQQIKRRHLTCLGECGQQIDTSSLLSLKERAQLLVNPILLNKIRGVIVNTIGGGLVAGTMRVLLQLIRTYEQTMGPLEGTGITLIVAFTFFLRIAQLRRGIEMGGESEAMYLVLAIIYALKFFKADDEIFLFPTGIVLFAFTGQIIEILRGG